MSPRSWGPTPYEVPVSFLKEAEAMVNGAMEGSSAQLKEKA